MKIFNLFVTKQCDRSCSYCFVQKARTTFNPYKIPSNLPWEKYQYICILGGEPGLLNEFEVKTLLDKVSYIPKDRRLIATNGLFLKKYFNKYPDLTYAYHITDLTEPPLSYKGRINFIIILTSDNIKQVIDYVKKYPDVTFTCNENIYESLFANSETLKDIRTLMKIPNLRFNKVVSAKDEYSCEGKIEALDYIL